MVAAGPVWALPPSPPESWGVRRRAALALGALLLVAPVLRLVTSDGPSDRAWALALVLATTAAVAAAAALAVLHSVRDDARLAWCAAGFAVAGLLAAGRALRGAPGEDVDAALRVLQHLAVPLAALTAGAAGHGLRRVALVLAPLVAAAAAVGLALSELQAPARAALLLSLVVAAVAAAVTWLRGSPETDAGPHAWVTAALVTTAAVATLDALQHTGQPARAPGETALQALTWPVPLLVAAGGLYVWSLRHYRRQSRRWRQLEGSVGALRASSPLMPGRAVTPEDEEGLPGAAEVRTLVRSQQVGIALQPVVRLADGVVVGHEALARFGGRVSTDRWFRGAGLHGMSEQLELVTVRAALALLPRIAEPESLAVNLSPLALADEQVLAELHRADLSRVVVEITEHEAVRDYGAARAHLASLRAAGARIAVDDIGAGFASLHHALLLRPDVVKLDQSLTRGVDHDDRQRELVVAVLRFADEVGVELIAEGVETAEQAATLHAMGLQLGQGWGLGVPVLQRAEP